MIIIVLKIDFTLFSHRHFDKKVMMRFITASKSLLFRKRDFTLFVIAAYSTATPAVSVGPDLDFDSNHDDVNDDDDGDDDDDEVNESVDNDFITCVLNLCNDFSEFLL